MRGSSGDTEYLKYKISHVSSNFLAIVNAWLSTSFCWTTQLMNSDSTWQANFVKRWGVEVFPSIYWGGLFTALAHSLISLFYSGPRRLCRRGYKTEWRRETYPKRWFGDPVFQGRLAIKYNQHKSLIFFYEIGKLGAHYLCIFFFICFRISNCPPLVPRPRRILLTKATRRVRRWQMRGRSFSHRLVQLTKNCEMLHKLKKYKDWLSGLCDSLNF